MVTALFHPRQSKRKSIIARSFLLGLLFFSNIHIQCVAAKATVAVNGGRDSIDVGDPISVDFTGSSTTSKRVWKIAIVQKGKSIRSQKNICNDCWKRVCGSQTCTERFASGTVTFFAEEIGGVGEYDAYLTTNSYIGRAGPVSFMVTSSPTAPINPSTSMPTIPDPSPAPSASPVASSNKACNSDRAKHCIEATLEDNGGSVRVSFANNSLQRGKIIFVRAGEQFINEDNVIVCEGIKMEKIVTKKNGAKIFDIQKCDLNVFDVYQTTNAYSTRIGPIRMKVTYPTEAPSPSPTESTKAPSPPPSKSTENPSPSPSQSPEAPSSSPTPDSVCNKSYSDEESLKALQGFTEGSELLSSFLTDFANGVEVVSDKNDRRLQDRISLTEALDLFSNQGPLGWTSLAFSIGTWIKASQDKTTQEILNKVNEISSKIDKLSTQLSDGIDYLAGKIENIENRFDQQSLDGIKGELDSQKDILESMKNSYAKYVEDPSNEYRENFRSTCNVSREKPEDVYRSFYKTSCRECAIQRKRAEGVFFDVTTSGDMETTARILNKRYSMRDGSDFRQGFGIPILTGMIDALHLQIQCLPQEPDTCLAEKVIWLDTVDAMIDGIVEVASHLSDRASQFDHCFKKSIRLQRVSTTNENKAVNKDKSKMKFQFNLNDDLYMPKSDGDCSNGMCKDVKIRNGCRPSCRFTTVSCTRVANYCEFSRKKNGFRVDSFPQSPWVDFAGPMELRFDAKGYSNRQLSFPIATFTAEEWYSKEKEITCDSYTVSKTVTINGAGGSIVNLQVRSNPRI